MGHAHLGQSLPETKDAPARSAIELAFAAFAPVTDRIAVVDLHDNHGVRDEHLWPLETAEKDSIDWTAARALLATLPAETVALLEIAHELGEDAKQVAEQARIVWERVGL